MLKPTSILRAAQWSSSLHLPKSTLPHRALSESRPAYIKRCTDDLYAWQAVNRPAKNTFVLADGPPYANGDLHVGHALNKVLKDIICRFQLSAGSRVHYVPGWDCHGLPIELKALQTLDAHTRMTPTEVRDAARKLASDTIARQKQSFRDWAVMADWKGAYFTMEQDFELRQLEVFKSMVQRGLIYRQYKPVHWSPSSRTALAEAELEYDDDHISHAAYIKFQIVDAPLWLSINPHRRKLFALIWTTTPWTLPANRAIAIHNDVEYSILEIGAGGDCVLVGSESIERVLKEASLEQENIRIVEKGLKGKHLVGMSYVNPLQGAVAKPQPILHGWFVNTTSGSGLVHMAPGHGQDDFDLCQKHGLEGPAPVDEAGCFTAQALPDDPDKLCGKPVLKEGNQTVLDLLRHEYESNLVWAVHKYKHKYPTDWRTKLPLIVRATAQWFAKVDSIKKQSMSAIEGVRFMPPAGKARLEAFISGRDEWCISRQRVWGVPIPALYRETDGDPEAVLTAESVDHIISVIRERGTNAWWTDPADDQSWVSPSLLNGNYTRGKDTMDVWFDSGTTWTQLPASEPGTPPADVYIEGSDQHRGWFQSSLLTYVASQQTGGDGATISAPYKNLITHGFTLDAQSRKMSKSLGNIISPNQIMEGTLLPPLKRRKGQPPTAQAQTHDAMGPDALRLWVASNDYTSDVSIGLQLLQSVNLSLHKFRITFRWLLGNLADFDPQASLKLESSGRLMDVIATHQLRLALCQAYTAYKAYEPFKAIIAVNRYISNDLSAFYFEAAKDPLYAGEADARFRVQQTCFEILKGLLQMLAPVLPLLVTEVVDHSTSKMKEYFNSEDRDPLKRIWNPPSTPKGAEVESLERRIKLLQATLTTVRAAQEKARAQKKLGSGLDCDVVLELPASSLPEWIHNFYINEILPTGELEEILVASRVHIKTAPSVISRSCSSPTTEPPDLSMSKEWEEFQHSLELSDFFPSFDETGKITAKIVPPSGSKCPRCWQYTVYEKSQDDGEDKLCKRCESVMSLEH